MKVTAKHEMMTYIDCKKIDLSKNEFEKAIRLTDARVIHSLEYHFKPQGLSILTLLAESHASFHSYPEYNLCYLDIFTCGNMEIARFDEALRKILQPRKVEKEKISRSI